MEITVIYRACDGARARRKYKSLDGARKYAQEMVGLRPEFGRDYAVSDDGIGTIRVQGVTLAELFPRDAAQPCEGVN